MVKPDDLSEPAVALDHDSTLVCVIEMSGTSWLVAATGHRQLVRREPRVGRACLRTGMLRAMRLAGCRRHRATPGRRGPARRGSQLQASGGGAGGRGC